MWKLTKRFLKAYLLLFVVSLVCFEHPVIQRFLVMVWILHIGLVAYNARMNRITRTAFLQVVVMSQLPGIILILFSLFNLFGEFNEWPNAVVETWYHPFTCVLEMLPHGYIGNRSDLYVKTCLIPAAITVIATIMWQTIVMVEYGLRGTDSRQT